MTRNRIIGFLAFGMLPLQTGCNLGLDFLLPTTVTITLVNGISGFVINGTLVIDNRKAIIKEDLVAFGNALDFTLGAGGPLSFTGLDCNNVESLVLDTAKLVLIGSIGPTTDSPILRLGTDFQCGDEIVFTFTGSLVDLVVATSTR